MSENVFNISVVRLGVLNMTNLSCRSIKLLASTRKYKKHRVAEDIFT